MKWLLYIPLALVALIVLIALIGLMLPKAHHASRMAEFQQPPELLFAAISGPRDWRPGVTSEALPSDGGPRKWREISGRHSITFEEVSFQPPRRFQSRIADKNLPFSGTWTWELIPTAAGCTCRITEDGEVSNLLFRFVSRYIIGHTRTIDDYLSALGKKFNQPVHIQD